MRPVGGMSAASCCPPRLRSNFIIRSGCFGSNAASTSPTWRNEPMRLPLYQVDAFTDTVFGGNPAAVVPLEAWLPDDRMQAIAAENNLAETAFFVPEGDGFGLRWFTPTTEVDLCGHATLAAAQVIMTQLRPECRRVAFSTVKAGTLTVARDGQ